VLPCCFFDFQGKFGQNDTRIGKYQVMPPLFLPFVTYTLATVVQLLYSEIRPPSDVS
jgi:hypothetical protein